MIEKNRDFIMGDPGKWKKIAKNGHHLLWERYGFEYDLISFIATETIIWKPKVLY